MKYRILCLVIAFVLVPVSYFFLRFEETSEIPKSRFHQHLSARPDTGCGCDGSQLCSHLPLIIIDTQGQEIPGKITEIRDRFDQATYTTAADGSPVIIAKATVIDNLDANNHPSDPPAIVSDCQLRIRGNSSRRFPKLPYLINFVDSEGINERYPLMGMDSHHEWALHGPILDKSLIRNYMWYNISGEIMDYAPNVRFFELIINGEYEGLYLAVETITNGLDCRLNLRNSVKNIDRLGYLLRIDRTTELSLASIADIYSYNERSFNIPQDISIQYPKLSRLTPELAKEIERDYSAFEKALFSYDYDTAQYGLWNWIDVDSFVDYFLINEMTGNIDAGNYSTYIYKDLGGDGKYKLCVWDFNNSCDNYIEDVTEVNDLLMIRRAWFFMLLKEETFVEQLLKRYEELRSTFFSDEYMLDYIDQTLAYLGPAVERNNQRWAVEMSQWNLLIPEERNVHSHQEAVNYLKEWLVARGKWLDENFHVMRQYAHPSRNKAFNH